MNRMDNECVNQCLNGHCPTQDQVCCDTACDQLCEACLASKNGGTWTILVTLLDGRSCLVSAGEGWNTIEPKDEGPGA